MTEHTFGFTRVERSRNGQQERESGALLCRADGLAVKGEGFGGNEPGGVRGEAGADEREHETDEGRFRVAENSGKGFLRKGV